MYSHLGRYEIKEELGRGAMGIVYKAYDPLIERFVAIKTINLNILAENERGHYKTRFFREAKAAGLLTHNNIVAIYDLGETGDVAYIAMELMEGRELQEYLGGERRIPNKEALEIAFQVANGLYFAHQNGIVHLDIKPSNIMLMGNNHIKIADFGIARIDSTSTTQVGLILGTPAYMSPEQFTGNTIDSRSDIFSLGVMLYQMLTGKFPFSGNNPSAIMMQTLKFTPPKPSSLNSEVNESLDALVLKCLEKNSLDRYRNAKELADALKACLENASLSMVGYAEPFIKYKLFNRLNKLVIPDATPEIFSTLGSYLFIVLVFILDTLTGSAIQMHLLYLFPLIVLGLHSERITVVATAVATVLFLESITLFSDPALQTGAKLFIASFVYPSNIFVAFLSRVARKNYFEVAHLATYDGLTGLHNRLSFESIVDMEIHGQKEYGGVFSVIFIKLDRVNIFSDASRLISFDEILKKVAIVINENTMQFDSTSRTGSAEFSILKPNTDGAYCKGYCKLLSEKLEKQIPGSFMAFHTIVGYVIFEKTPLSVSEVFYQVENAMNEKKGNQNIPQVSPVISN